MSTEDVTAEIAALADVIFENSDEPMWSAVVIAKAQWDALADLLAARDRRVRAEALREAAEEVRDRTLTPALEGARPKKWLDGERFGRHIAAVVLRDRADRLEADA